MQHSDKNKWAIRLLSYAQATSVIREFEKLGGYGNFQNATVYLQGTTEQMDKIVAFMAVSEMDFEFKPVIQ